MQNRHPCDEAVFHAGTAHVAIVRARRIRTATVPREFSLTDNPNPTNFGCAAST